MLLRKICGSGSHTSAKLPTVRNPCTPFSQWRHQWRQQGVGHKEDPAAKRRDWGIAQIIFLVHSDPVKLLTSVKGETKGGEVKRTHNMPSISALLACFFDTKNLPFLQES
ncbi:hypothetical protein M758_4G117000 [Ceratodon purpureus]|uniref:Uncharacterized protein n=1 Tax=Ceratodon purpureus TaxID=3225 RepID=A0A8T0IB16_CERPU|nr:hypothetical protein KC19_4G117200 [Ceratodon purpureus]KAG0619103.1 hypothetical protein M758_4G117000 [Ceratodon purpureus]